MRQFYALLIFSGICTSVFAQQAPSFWQQVDINQVVLPENSQRMFEPHEYTAYSLDFDAITAAFAQAPVEWTKAAKDKKCIVNLPKAEGGMEAYAVEYVQVMAPELAAKYPEIRTYAGESTTEPGKRARITISPYRGVEIMVRRADKGVEYIEPIAEGQHQVYMAYDRKQIPNEMYSQLPAKYELPQELASREGQYSLGAPQAVGAREVVGNISLKVYRFACAATGEFSQDNGGTTASVLSKVTTVTNTLNGIYEVDLDIRLQLIAEEDLILFLDPNTDPYTGNTVGEWMTQNPAAMASTLGSATKYDIGHLFARYISGDAIGVAGGWTCTVFKGRGCSGGNPPYGDFFLGVCGQEIGHQWAAGHTWNYCLANNQFSYDSACEPGSGSTIMSYAGACGNDNIQNSADLYYNACSIYEIKNFVLNGDGNLCGSSELSSNQAPTVALTYSDNFFIPISTPFELIGDATDPDGDVMSYNWEEIDLGPSSPLGSPQGNSPLFRSYPPTSAKNRVFPRLQSIIANTSSIKEVLPTYTRDLTFAFVARDNRTDGGGIGLDTVSFASTAQAGPFLVSSPNASFVNWKVGEYQMVTWDVANTDKLPVNCQTVNIRLSTNNGAAFPITIASGLPNIGQACILVPNNVSSAARIRVEAADNIFFDISNAGFKIEQPTTPGFSFCTSVLESKVCLPTVFSTQVSLVGVAGFSDFVTLSAEGLPAGVTASFTQNPIQPGGNVNMYLNFPDNFPEGNYDVVVKGTSGANSLSRTITLTVVNNDYSAFHLQTPADGSTGVDKVPVLHWADVPDANYYEVQLANAATFEAGNIVATTQSIVQDSFKVPVFLDEGKVYFWRVRPVNECGTGPWSDIYTFSTRVLSCNTYNANDLPKVISANAPNTIESKVTVNSGGLITDLNITKIKGSHQFFKDLEFHLISPANTDVLLVKDKCSSYSGNFNFGFDDSSPSPFGCPPSQTGLTYKPTGTLSNFIGQNSTGIWTLRVKDNQISSGGQLLEFAFEVCGSVSVASPLIIKNNVLQVESGTNAGIGNDLLKAEEGATPASALTYTLLSVPAKGDLRFNFGNVMKIGDQFSQADIDNGALRFFDAGAGVTTDHFRFAVTNGQGGLVTGEFTIQPFTVGTFEARDNMRFDLAPNPAKENVRLAFPSATESSTVITLFDAAGRQIRTFTMPAGELSTVIDIASLPDGFYAVSVQSQQGRGMKKLVVGK